MGAYFTLSSIIYIAIFIYYFFSKETVKTVETKIYKILLITTFIGLCLDATSFFAYQLGMDYNSFLYHCLSKGMLIYFLVWIGSFTYYIYAISYSDHENVDYYKYRLKRFGNILRIFITIVMILAFILPVSFNIKGNVIFPLGIGVDLTYITVFICVILCFIFAFKNIKHIMIKKYTPLFAMVVLVIISALIQKIFPELFLVNFAVSTIILLLYFSIENPDIKLINELTYSKELLNKSNEESNKRLNLLTKNLDRPIEMLSEFANKKIVSDNKKLHNEINELQKESVLIVDEIKGILELTKLEGESNNIEKYNYNLEELISEIKHLLLSQSEKKIALSFDIEDDLQKVLKGDALKIKQTIINLYDYLIDKLLIKKILFKVSDTNTKITSRLKFSFVFEKGIKELKNRDIEMEIINRLVELQNAKLDIKEENNLIQIDFYVNQNKVLKYDVEEEIIKEKKVNYFDCKQKKVLIIDDNLEKIDILTKLLKPYNLDINVAHNYSEYEEEIFSKNNYSLILLDDMMPDSNKFEFLNLTNEEMEKSINNIKSLTNDNLPLVLMITPNNEIDKINYEYLLKPINKNELDKVIRKYML